MLSSRVIYPFLKKEKKSPFRSRRLPRFFRRDQILKLLRNREGVHCGGCGVRTVRVRPALIFTSKHAEIFIEKMDNVLKTL